MRTASSTKSPERRRSNTATIKETDLFEPVKRLFEERGYTIYSEVEGPSGRADIVAISGHILAVIELKTSLSLELVLQAVGWEQYANYRYVAVPKRKGGAWEARRFLERLGIGFIEVDFPQWSGEPHARITANSRLVRRTSESLRNALREEQRHGPAGGTKGGGYVTEYRLTMDRVRRTLQYYPENDGWMTINELLDVCETHYMQPKQSLAKALLTLEADWCESAKINGKTHFRYRKPKAKEA